MNMKASIGIACTFILIVGWVAFCGYRWSWGPFAGLYDLKTGKLPGNAPQYGVDTISVSEESPLRGKTVLFLGSSVTYGAASKGISFADYLAGRSGCVMIKEAVSGTTLVDNGPHSYLRRLRKWDASTPVDLFVCQLSTNDASQNQPLGAVSTDGIYDTTTVAGAIESIISYAKEVWNCPVVFYTNPRYDSEDYSAMVALLAEIAEKRNITVIDLWNDADFNEIRDEQRTLYMADAIHPTQAGYREWWTPYMENVLIEVLDK